jgi:prolyl-tRNA editing enzyme YbaK/EbsC (Cys-tRNA(Pro) deacylase)
MAIEKVREYLKIWNRDRDIIEFAVSTATVAEAAAALGVEGARIAKSISLKGGAAPARSAVFIIVTAGDTKIDNRKFRDFFGFKAKMLSAEETLERTGHAAGGVCPFGLPDGVDVYLDLSLKRFAAVFPACGSANSAIKLTPDELREYSRAKAWINVCSTVTA